MIRFFRQIRYTLMSDPPERAGSVRAGGKTSKYLKYAIGEILLVVIGILIALQINNWNENRKAISQKNDYCIQLISALKEDHKTLQEFQDRLLVLEEMGVYLWEFVNGTKKEIDTNQFKNYFLSVANSFDFAPKTAVYDNLVASNVLSLIQNDTLKNQIAYYYLPHKGNDEVALQRIQYATAYNDLRFEFISPMMLKKYLRVLFDNPTLDGKSVYGRELGSQILNKNVDLSEFSVDWEKLKGSEAYKTFLARMLAVREPVFDRNKRTDRLISDMIKLLEKEIRE